MLLTPREQAELNKGPKQKQTVGKHERIVILRSEQCIKDRTIENFAVAFCSQLERFGVSAADRRHVRNLIEILRQRTK